MKKALCFFLIELGCLVAIFGQGKFNIHSFDYTVLKNGKLKLSNPQYLSEFNKEGYVNQPTFVDAEHLLITSDHQDGQNNDIYKLNVLTKELSNITNSVGKSEYSPTPHQDGQSFYVVREEGDGITQAFHKYPLDMQNGGLRMMPMVNNIGYFQFFGQDSLVYFAVDTPNNNLILASKNGENQKIIEKNPGRSLKKDKAGNLYYAIETKKDSFELIKWSFKSGKKNKLGFLPSQDFTITPGNEIISSKGNLIYQYNKKTKRWNKIADILEFGLRNASRMAISKKKFIVVTNSES
jgi:hypothetical protein